MSSKLAFLLRSANKWERYGWIEGERYERIVKGGMVGSTDGEKEQTYHFFLLGLIALILGAVFLLQLSALGLHEYIQLANVL